MADYLEIKRYDYYVFSSRETDEYLAVIRFYGSTAYIGGAAFSSDPSTPLKPATKSASGIVGVYYRMSEFPVITDMLRNEGPVYLIFDGERNSRVSTNPEPVGEGEV